MNVVPTIEWALNERTHAKKRTLYERTEQTTHWFDGMDLFLLQHCVYMPLSHFPPFSYCNMLRCEYLRLVIFGISSRPKMSTKISLWLAFVYHAKRIGNTVERECVVVNHWLYFLNTSIAYNVWKSNKVKGDWIYAIGCGHLWPNISSVSLLCLLRFLRVSSALNHRTRSNSVQV